jgi:RNA polymerase sigma factor (sigma-70 family)
LISETPWRSAAFPATRPSILERLRSAQPEARRAAFGTLVDAYWKPIYTYLRARWKATPQDAEDTTQAFLASALEKGYFAAFDPSKARFRTFLRVCLDRFVMNERKSARARKRGGDARFVGLDFESAEGEWRRQEPRDPADTEELFRQEWIRHLFARTVDAVRDELVAAGKRVQFDLFEAYDLAPAERTTYAELAARFGLSVAQVTNYLYAARRAFRTRALENLRAISGSDEEYRAEARELFGIEVA